MWAVSQVLIHFIVIQGFVCGFHVKENEIYSVYERSYNIYSKLQ